MSQETQARFDGIVARHVDRPDATVGGGMMKATGMLKISGKIAAMLVDGDLVVKLPAARVTSLVEAGHGERFMTKPAKPMKQWLAVPPAASAPGGPGWADLVDEAVGFAAGGG